MVYAANTEGILNWKLDQHSIIHRAHHVWFEGYVEIYCKLIPGLLNQPEHY